MRRLLSIHGRKYAMERVAAFLDSLVDESSAPAEIAIPVSRGEAADYIGLTIESTSRCFSKLKRLEVLGKESGDLLHVLDWARLRRIARGVEAVD